MHLKEFWIEIINKEANTTFIRNSLIAGWLFFSLCFFIDLLYPNDSHWFQRSGAILCMISVIVEFRLSQLDRASLFNDWQERIEDKINFDSPMFTESNLDKGLKFIAHLSMVIGTAVWAYGDKIV